MGFYPKHLKVRRFKFIMRVIANAALAGAQIERVVYTSGGEPPVRIVQYRHRASLGHYTTKSEAATDYLFFHFAELGIKPVWARTGFGIGIKPAWGRTRSAARSANKRRRDLRYAGVRTGRFSSGSSASGQSN